MYRFAALSVCENTSTAVFVFKPNLKWTEYLKLFFSLQCRISSIDENPEPSAPLNSPMLTFYIELRVSQ